MQNYSTTELHKAALCAALGGTAGILFARIHMQNDDYVSWFDNLKKPSYSLTKLKHFAVGGTISSAALHGSAYLIYLEGTEHNDVRVALGLSGGLMGFAAVSSYAMVKNRCLKHSSIAAVATTALTWATGYSFYKISPLAGYLMVAPALWMFYASSVLCGIKCLNREDCKEHGS